MATVRVQSGWAGQGLSLDPYRPEVVFSYALTDWVDLLGAAPVVNTTAVEASCPDATALLILSDPRYPVFSVEGV